ncbi:hypothetical protein JX266_004897 [Neoarthrinium moseri]|nr:hypothetical protein JX266_004897 [Neoarthrinium moseri]
MKSTRLGTLPYALLALLATGARAGVDNPTPENFIRRFYASAVVLGEYLYIDGGELGQLVNGVQSQPSYPVNGTLSVSLKSAWTNETVTMRYIKKSAPLQNQQVVWVNPSTSSFFAWGGMTADSGPAAEKEVWKFTADGFGSGDWSQAIPYSVVAFNDAHRTVSSAFTSVDGVGYSIGGTMKSTVDSSITDGNETAVQGIITFDMGSMDWANLSSAGMGPYGTTMNGRLEYVPFGPKGFLVVLGGSVPPVGVLSQYAQQDWNNIWIMDLGTKKWHHQAVSGSKPTNRERFCTIGTQGLNGTYEIFIHAGYSTPTADTASDVFVLSLPGFVMFKSPNSGTPRQDHACVAIGGNSSSTSQRQMLVVGGLNGARANAAMDPDPWARGLGIFDMTEMVWSSSYDPQAAVYDSPAVVKTWYSQGGLDAVNWANDEVKTLFVSGTNSSANNGNGTSTSSGDSSTPIGSSGAGMGNNNTGAILGGTIGGACGLAIIGVLSFLLWRQRKRLQATQQQQYDVPPDLDKTSADGTTHVWNPQSSASPAEMPAWPRQPVEVDRTQQPVEADGTQRPVEADGAPMWYELPDQGYAHQAR